MPAIAPVAASVATTNRHEGATTKLADLAAGNVNEAVYADSAKHNVLGNLSSYNNLDTVKDQQTETTPVPAPTTETGTATDPQSNALPVVGP